MQTAWMDTEDTWSGESNLEEFQIPIHWSSGHLMVSSHWVEDLVIGCHWVLDAKIETLWLQPSAVHPRLVFILNIFIINIEFQNYLKLPREVMLSTWAFFSLQLGEVIMSEIFLIWGNPCKKISSEKIHVISHLKNIYHPTNLLKESPEIDLLSWTEQRTYKHVMLHLSLQKTCKEMMSNSFKVIHTWSCAWSQVPVLSLL